MQGLHARDVSQVAAPLGPVGVLVLDCVGGAGLFGGVAPGTVVPAVTRC